MSYDLEIATHDRPSPEQVEAWAREQDLVTVAGSAGSINEIERAGRTGPQHLFGLDGPTPVEAEDLDEQTAAACLDPRWLVSVQVPASSSERARTLARSLARHLAQANGGAAFDPQADRLLWPRGRKPRVRARRTEERIDLVELRWFLPPGRWPAAPQTLVDLLRRHCPEALPRRYGVFEPLEYRASPDALDEFVRFLREPQNDQPFWYASRPSFGGMAIAPTDPYAQPGDEDTPVAELRVEIDGSVLRDDPRWREATVALFLAGAAQLGAFFAVAHVQRGWLVSTNNRLWADERTQSTGSILRGRNWQGLPATPTWLTWFGGPYRELVAPHLTGEALAATLPDVTVEARADGLFVRIGAGPHRDDPSLRWPIPAELTYRRTSRRPPPIEDAAAVIPPLG